VQGLKSLPRSLRHQKTRKGTLRAASERRASWRAQICSGLAGPSSHDSRSENFTLAFIPKPLARPSFSTPFLL
jgi:hypothetical protein